MAVSRHHIANIAFWRHDIALLNHHIERYHVMGDTNSPQNETHTGCLIFASQSPQNSLKIVAELWKAT